MKEGPDIALLGSLIGDPARANMLSALMSGKALTASELALVAGVTGSTASSHLKKLLEAGLLRQRRQGRHRYFALSDDDVSSVLEALMGLAAKRGHMRMRTGPKDPMLRKARVCYNHLAGEMGVQLFDSLVAQQFLRAKGDELCLTSAGHLFVCEFGIDVKALGSARRPLCKSCLDWSVRKTHLAGSLGTAFLDHFNKIGWTKRREGSRIIAFSKSGEKKFLSQFPL